VLTTYKAFLKGNRLEWNGPAPSHLDAQRGIPVQVTVLDEESVVGKGRGLLMAAALERLAASGAVRGIPDPAVWERETREDRPLPEREA